MSCLFTLQVAFVIHLTTILYYDQVQSCVYRRLRAVDTRAGEQQRPHYYGAGGGG